MKRRWADERYYLPKVDPTNLINLVRSLTVEGSMGKVSSLTAKLLETANIPKPLLRELFMLLWETYGKRAKKIRLGEFIMLEEGVFLMVDKEGTLKIYEVVE